MSGAGQDGRREDDQRQEQQRQGVDHVEPRVEPGEGEEHREQEDDAAIPTEAETTRWLALLDRGKRSATVEADGYLVCHVLPLPQFDAIAAPSATSST